MTRAVSARGLRLLAHHDLDGYGDGMQVLREGDALYVGHFGTSGMGTSVLDVSEPARPALVEQIPAPPGTHTHKVQVADGLLLVNQERFRGGDPYEAGMVVYDVATDPLAPRVVGRFESGGLGVHRIVWTGGRFAHASAIPDGFEAGVYVIDGSGVVGEDQGIGTGELAVLAGTQGALRVRNAGTGTLEFMVLGGAPAEGPLVFHGPFVMNSVDQVRAAEIAYRTGRMGEL